MSEINPDPLAAATRGEVNERGEALDVVAAEVKPVVGSVWRSVEHPGDEPVTVEQVRPSVIAGGGDAVKVAGAVFPVHEFVEWFEPAPEASAAAGSVSDMLANEAYAGRQEPASVPLDEVALTLRGSGYDSADLRFVFGGTTDADVARRAELAELADSHPDPLVRWACDLTSDSPPPVPAEGAATPDCVAELAELVELVERTAGPALELPAEALAITEPPTVAELQRVAVGLVDLDPLPGLTAAAGRPAAPIPAPRAEVTPPALGKALRRRR